VDLNSEATRWIWHARVHHACIKLGALLFFSRTRVSVPLIAGPRSPYSDSLPVSLRRHRLAFQDNRDSSILPHMRARQDAAAIRRPERTHLSKLLDWRIRIASDFAGDEAKQPFLPGRQAPALLRLADNQESRSMSVLSAGCVDSPYLLGKRVRALALAACCAASSPKCWRTVALSTAGGRRSSETAKCVESLGLGHRPQPPAPAALGLMTPSFAAGLASALFVVDSQRVVRRRPCSKRINSLPGGLLAGGSRKSKPTDLPADQPGRLSTASSRLRTTAFIKETWPHPPSRSRRQPDRPRSPLCGLPWPAPPSDRPGWRVLPSG